MDEDNMMDEPLTDAELAWMVRWCTSKGLRLDLHGEVGFGRECVGVATHGHYPSYLWYNETDYSREDNNGDVWTPGDAYHKYPCVAVLGRGPQAERQLYNWLKWFDDNNFYVTVTEREKTEDLLATMLHGIYHVRMVRA